MSRSHLLAALFVAYSFSIFSDVSADSVWQGSYSVAGQCFCSGEIAAAVSTQIVPTPIGGQTVKQVCAKLGKGPGLTAQNGEFNYPVFKDPQCGHGPFLSENGPSDPDCVGSTNGTSGSCQSAGPKWALSQAYAQGGDSDSTMAKNSSAIVVNSPVDSQSRPAAALPAASTDNNADKQAETAANASTTPGDLPEGFTGKSVVLGNDRFLQARTGLPAQGGALGSRIILDGTLFIRQDDNLNTADLYRPEKKPDVPQAQLATKAQQSPTLITEQSDVASNEQSDFIEPVPAAAKPIVVEKTDNEETRQARLDKEKMQREAQARADYEAQARADYQARARAADEAEQKERDARLAMESESRQQIDKQGEQSDPAYSDKEQQSDGVTDEKALAQASAQSDNEESDSVNKIPVLASALRLPAGARASSRDFAYIEAMPASYDIGGAGLVIEGSAQSNARVQYLGRAGISDTYQELMLGGGYFLTPPSATRMTVVLLAGIEFGGFELRDEARAPGLTVNSADNGIFLSAMSRFVINNKFELKAGVGYSSFFGGDATLSGGGYYHVTPRLDVMSRFELGDNDLLGIGIRYYY